MVGSTAASVDARAMAWYVHAMGEPAEKRPKSPSVWELLRERRAADPELFFDLSAQVIKLYLQIERRVAKLTPLVAFLTTGTEHYWKAAAQRLLEEDVRRASVSPDEDSPDRAPIPVPEAAETEADDPKGLSDEAPSNTTAPAAAPTESVDNVQKRTVRPFQKELFARLVAAEAYPEEAVKIAEEHLRFEHEADARGEDWAFHDIFSRVGPPGGVSPAPDLKVMRAQARLIREYHEALLSTEE